VQSTSAITVASKGRSHGKRRIMPHLPSAVRAGRAGRAERARRRGAVDRRRELDDVLRLGEHQIGFVLIRLDLGELHQIAAPQVGADLLQEADLGVALAQQPEHLVGGGLEPVEAEQAAEVLPHHVADLVDELRRLALLDHALLAPSQVGQELDRDLPRRPRRRWRRQHFGPTRQPAHHQPSQQRNQRGGKQRAADVEPGVVVLHHHDRLGRGLGLGVRLVGEQRLHLDRDHGRGRFTDHAVLGHHAQRDRRELVLARLEREQIEVEHERAPTALLRLHACASRRELEGRERLLGHGHVVAFGRIRAQVHVHDVARRHRVRRFPLERDLRHVLGRQLDLLGRRLGRRAGGVGRS
jgi:hypothetical protein